MNNTLKVSTAEVRWITWYPSAIDSKSHPTSHQHSQRNKLDNNLDLIMFTIYNLTERKKVVLNSFEYFVLSKKSH